MQVLSTGRPNQFVPGRASIAVGVAVGAFLVGLALAVGWLVFTTPLLGSLMPGGRATIAQIAIGMLAWTIALAAPAAFALVGAARLAAAVSELAARRPRPTPAASVSGALGDEYAVAVRVRLPDATRPIDELVIGPFGAAIIEELPPAHAARHKARQWEVRGRDGRWRSIDSPLERAARDAESVRRWFTRDDRDHVVKVFAAVVGTDPTVERTSDCAVLGPGQVAAWISGLPAQRMLTADRREQILEIVRGAV
jgi:hypothetical protein